LFALTGDRSAGAAILNPVRGDAPFEVHQAVRQLPQPPQPPELDEEPVAAAAASPDPRRLVPLPWDRYVLRLPSGGGLSFRLLNPAYDTDEGWARLLIALPGLVAFLVVVPLVTVPIRRRRRRTLTAAQLKQIEKRGWLIVGASVVSAFVLTAFIGGAWLWHDADRLFPGEHYRWDYWYITFVQVAALGVGLLLAGGGLLLGAGRFGIWLSRKLLRARRS
jgi:hypothetical protein